MSNFIGSLPINETSSTSEMENHEIANLFNPTTPQKPKEIKPENESTSPLGLVGIAESVLVTPPQPRFGWGDRNKEATGFSPMKHDDADAFPSAPTKSFPSIQQKKSSSCSGAYRSQHPIFSLGQQPATSNQSLGASLNEPPSNLQLPDAYANQSSHNLGLWNSFVAPRTFNAELWSSFANSSPPYCNTPIGNSLTSMSSLSSEYRSKNADQLFGRGQTMQPFEKGQTMHSVDTDQLMQPFERGQTMEPFGRCQTMQPFCISQTMQPFNSDQTIRPFDRDQTRQPFDRRQTMQPFDRVQTFQPFDMGQTFDRGQTLQQYGLEEYQQPMHSSRIFPDMTAPPTLTSTPNSNVMDPYNNPIISSRIIDPQHQYNPGGFLLRGCNPQFYPMSMTPPISKHPVASYGGFPGPVPNSQFLGMKPKRECKFCKNNGEMPELYRSHVLRNPSTGSLVCPILRDHICELCGASGDNAHTRNYCPTLKTDDRLKCSVPVCLKKTRRQSNGQIRGLNKLRWTH